MYFKKILILVLLTTIGCSSLTPRKPASKETDLELDNIFKRIQNTNICTPEFSQIYTDLFKIAGANYFDFNDLETIEQKIRESFNSRIYIKESLKNFEINNESDRKCLNTTSDVFKALRYVEDYLVELYFEKKEAGKEKTEFVNLTGEFPYLLINPKYENDFKDYKDLKSGDVLLSRGGAYSSAAIARIGVSDYQFSHLSFVYRDADTKELFTTEAHIEIGSVTAPFKAHLDEKNARTVIFRYKNSEIAQLASKFSFDHVRKQQATKKNIAYDFSMNYKDDSRLFCSEVISYGFKNVMPDADYIPKFKSKFTKGMIPFLNGIGVPVNNDNIDILEVFAPGDIQFDPNFDLIAEWRNPLKIEESRFKDFILTKMFERMDSQDYKIDPNFKMDVEARAFWLLRRTPLVKKFLNNKFSLTMNPTQMEIFMALDKIGEVLYKEIEATKANFDHPMTPFEIYKIIDDFMQKDLAQYEQYKNGIAKTKPMLHMFFHP